MPPPKPQIILVLRLWWCVVLQQILATYGQKASRYLHWSSQKEVVELIGIELRCSVARIKLRFLGILPLLEIWPIWVRESHYIVSAMFWSSWQIVPNVCFRRPVTWMYLSRGRVAAGCVKRWEMSCVRRRNFLWSMECSRWYLVQLKRKWCTVLMAFSLQLGQWGESKHLIQWRCLFNPMCPVWSCMTMEVCLCDSSLTSFIHFFNRTDLSIPLM